MDETPFELLTRRSAVTGVLASFALVALVREARAVEGPHPITVRKWMADQQEIAETLAAGRMTGSKWAQNVRELAAAVDVAELMAVVRRSRIVTANPPSHNDPQKRFVRFLDEQGQPRQLAYGIALFDFQPHNVVTPHGHRHMVSAHMVLEGRLRVRNFDRLADEDATMVIRATKDYVARVGDVSTMAPEEDNVHWFVPLGGPATTLDLVVSGLDAGAPDHLIQAIDPLRAARRLDGTLVAPIIGFGEAARRYTARV